MKTEWVEPEESIINPVGEHSKGPIEAPLLFMIAEGRGEYLGQATGLLQDRIVNDVSFVVGDEFAAQGV